jgi:hypothetical protein
MVLASDDSDASDSSGRAGCSGKGHSRSCGRGSSRSCGESNSRSCGEGDSRGIDGDLTSGTGSAGSHSGLEGPRELDPEEVGTANVVIKGQQW